MRPFGPVDLSGNTVSTRVAAAQLSTGLVIISDTEALDVRDHYYVAQPGVGEVGLYEINKGLLAKIALPKR